MHHETCEELVFRNTTGKPIAWIRVIDSNDAPPYAICSYHLERADDVQQSIEAERFFRAALERCRSTGTALFDHDEITKVQREAYLQTGKTANEFTGTAGVHEITLKLRDLASNRILEVRIHPVDGETDV